MTNEIGVGDQNARCVIVCLEHSNWLARLHEQCFIVAEILQALDNGAIGFPTTRGASGSSVNDKVFRTLGDFGVEIVHQHAHGSFLLPTLASDLGSARCANRCGSLDLSFDGHASMVMAQDGEHKLVWKTLRKKFRVSQFFADFGSLHFGNPGTSGWYPPSPWSIAISDLAEICEIIYGAQLLTGKVLDPKQLAFFACSSCILPSPWR